jgi:DNA-binding MurR/RpiR family transcriptional regulator
VTRRAKIKVDDNLPGPESGRRRRGGRGPEVAEVPETTLRNCTFPLRFNTMRTSLTEAETKVGEYFLKNPESVYLSITEVAQTSGLGYGSIIRFCQKIGCTGFQDFKVLLAQELRVGRASGSADADPIGAYVGKLQADLANTVTLLDRKVMAQVAKCLAEAHFVLIAGIAGSAALAYGLNYRMSRLGIRAAADHEGYTMAIRAATLGKGDVFFGMSFSGSTKDTVNAARIARERGATVIALTAFIQSPLGELAHFNLVGASDRDPFSCEIFPNAPRDFVLDLLVLEICRIRPEAQEVIRRTFEVVSDRRI